MEAARGAEFAAVAGLLEGAAQGQSGALWRLEGAERQLDVNLVRHLPGTGGAAYTEDEVDVMLVVVAGGGTLTLDGTVSQLAPGFLGLLPRGTSRALLAGPEGLIVLTAHRRRRGMRIGRAEPAATTAAEPAAMPRSCALHLVCGRCHRHAIEADARFCSGCGTALPSRPAA
ncbi:zinc ribbon domain-containing protein [Streptomyces sp. NBC_00160]|uniref:zinc ribbon domain-containing protein n=1 Tax=Streptomyces sp. NBC_00160 TaxID=2903628 RepID=UPI0022524F5D|nr:zinc ribbon domain-containing protein [Streptomyces sp. NBC_00160]MCX5308803.1 zinc ribbon domain-containing protein [Streptomyces sp. NBC_00160]